MSANTDGIVVKVYKHKKSTYDDIIKEWMKETKLGLDSEEYKCYINRDINNYVIEELNGKISYKGALHPTMYANDLQKGYDMPIVAKAVVNFFLYNKPILETLYESINILDFCKTQNVNKKFIIVYNEGSGPILMQQNNRYYVTNGGGIIEKVLKNDPDADCYIDDNGNITNTTNSKNNLCAGYNITILNTLDDMSIHERNINYTYYYKEALKIIDPIKLQISPNQKGNPIHKTKSGKILIKQNSGMYNSLFDDYED